MCFVVEGFRFVASSSFLHWTGRGGGGGIRVGLDVGGRKWVRDRLGIVASCRKARSCDFSGLSRGESLLGEALETEYTKLDFYGLR